jgi:hypothetical protein
MVTSQLNQLVPSVMALVKERNIPVKLAAEKALVQLLDLARQGESVMETYLKKVPASDAKALSDYHRRVLSKLVSTTTTTLSEEDREADTVLPSKLVPSGLQEHEQEQD